MTSRKYPRDFSLPERAAISAWVDTHMEELEGDARYQELKAVAENPMRLDIAMRRAGIVEQEKLGMIPRSTFVGVSTRTGVAEEIARLRRENRQWRYTK